MIRIIVHLSTSMQPLSAQIVKNGVIYVATIYKFEYIINTLFQNIVHKGFLETQVMMLSKQNKPE